MQNQQEEKKRSKASIFFETILITLLASVLLFGMLYFFNMGLIIFVNVSNTQILGTIVACIVYGAPIGVLILGLVYATYEAVRTPANEENL